MQITDKLPSYPEVIAILKCSKDSTLPAQLHGFASGILCGAQPSQKIGFEEVIAKLQEDGIDSKQAQKAMADITVITLTQLQGVDNQFNLLLPSDDDSLSWRVACVADWCQHFLSGIGSVGITEKELSLAETKEALRDIASIANLKKDSIVADEESESSYTEIVEFLRVAVPLLYIDLHPLKK